MPDPQDEAPQTGEVGSGQTAGEGAAAFETEGPTPEQLAERDERISTRRKPMGPPPDDSRRAGAFNDEPPAPDVPPTTPA
jgi:hypothetical protein